MLEGRGYPHSILSDIKSAYHLYDTKFNVGLLPPGSVLDHQWKSRKEGCIKQAVKYFECLETANDTGSNTLHYPYAILQVDHTFYQACAYFWFTAEVLYKITYGIFFWASRGLPRSGVTDDLHDSENIL